MQAHDGRAIAKRCYLCKATPSAVGKRGEASHADLGGVRLFEGLVPRLNLFAFAVPEFRGGARGGLVAVVDG